MHFRLYVAGNAPNSERARLNLNQFCEARFPEGCEIDIVDVFVSPHKALEDSVMLTPTLLVLDAPSRRIVGDLSDPAILESLVPPRQASS